MKEPISARKAPESVSQSKRNLIKTGWVVPVVAAVTLPRSSFAANVSRSRQVSDDGKGHGRNKKS